MKTIFETYKLINKTQNQTLPFPRRLKGGKTKALIEFERFLLFLELLEHKCTKNKA